MYILFRLLPPIQQESVARTVYNQLCQRQAQAGRSLPLLCRQNGLYLAFLTLDSCWSRSAYLPSPRPQITALQGQRRSDVQLLPIGINQLLLQPKAQFKGLEAQCPLGYYIALDTRHYQGYSQVLRKVYLRGTLYFPRIVRVL